MKGFLKKCVKGLDNSSRYTLKTMVIKYSISHFFNLHVLPCLTVNCCFCPLFLPASKHERQAGGQTGRQQYNTLQYPLACKKILFFRQFARISCKLGSKRRLLYFSEASIPGLTAAIISVEDSLVLACQDGPDAEHRHRPTKLHTIETKYIRNILFLTIV